MNIKIIGTGSSGNCFLFDEKLMIDAGLSYKKLSNQINVKDVKCVLLTHIHGDHFNRACLRKLFVNTGAIFCCGDWLLDELLNIGISKDRIMILQPNKVYKIMDYTVSL